MATEESLEQLRQRCAVSTKLWGRMFSGLAAMTFRMHGAKALDRLWYDVLTNHQGEFYKEGMRKLGIEDDPPAVAAAKYHYFTNLIGGLGMEYVEESPRKVWIRYLSPLWTYDGVAMLALPASLRRTILGSWHPLDGVYMENPRLGFVATKFIMEGEPYDEGYFLEYDHDLRPEERMRYEVATTTPEFDPAAAPQLDPVLWPEERQIKARRNYSSDYVRTTVDVLMRTYGEAVAIFIIQQTMRCLAIQYIAQLKDDLKIEGNDIAAVAQLFAGLLDACFQEFETTKLSDRSYQIVVKSFKPFEPDISENMRAALFNFQQMGARVLNGHLLVTRHMESTNGHGGQDVWLIEDTGRWLW